MDFSKKTIELANELLPPGTPMKQTLTFIEKVSFALEAAYNAGLKIGVQDGKKQEKERGSRRNAIWHSDSCYSENCLGQCRER